MIVFFHCSSWTLLNLFHLSLFSPLLFILVFKMGPRASACRSFQRHLLRNQLPNESLSRSLLLVYELHQQLHLFLGPTLPSGLYCNSKVYTSLSNSSDSPALKLRKQFVIAQTLLAQEEQKIVLFLCPSSSIQSAAQLSLPPHFALRATARSGQNSCYCTPVATISELSNRENQLRVLLLLPQNMLYFKRMV